MESLLWQTLVPHFCNGLWYLVTTIGNERPEMPYPGESYHSELD
jgi:succinate dehydrogenase/fumarate reductase cytochrome b subunit